VLPVVNEKFAPPEPLYFSPWRLEKHSGTPFLGKRVNYGAPVAAAGAAALEIFVTRVETREFSLGPQV